MANIIYNNFIRYEVTTFVRLQENEKELRNNLAKEFHYLKNIPLYKAKIAELTKLESEIKQRFLHSAELAQLLVKINQLAEDSQVVVTDFSSQGKRELRLSLADLGNNTIIVETATLSITGSYGNFIDFIYQIAALSQTILVDGFRIVRVDDQIINATFTIKLFYSNKV